jgi:hypothetical protein
MNKNSTIDKYMKDMENRNRNKKQNKIARLHNKRMNENRQAEINYAIKNVKPPYFNFKMLIIAMEYGINSIKNSNGEEISLIKEDNFYDPSVIIDILENNTEKCRKFFKDTTCDKKKLELYHKLKTNITKENTKEKFRPLTLDHKELLTFINNKIESKEARYPTYGPEYREKMGGKRKRKTLKRKRSKKTKNNKKSRKSKRKMTRRRRRR